MKQTLLTSQHLPSWFQGLLPLLPLSSFFLGAALHSGQILDPKAKGMRLIPHPFCHPLTGTERCRKDLYLVVFALSPHLARDRLFSL